MPGRPAAELVARLFPPDLAALVGVDAAEADHHLASVAVALGRQGVSVRPVMREAAAHHAARAGEKLRAEGLVAGRMMVLLHTNPHSGEPYYSAQHGSWIEPSADTGALVGEAVRMLRPLWRAGHRYLKVGVVLDDLRNAATEPRNLFATRDPVRSAKLMAALDAVNARFMRGTLRPLSTGLAKPWGARHARLSARHTTRLDELMEVKAW